MSYLNKIKKPYLSDIQLFEKKFKESLSSKVPLLDTITYYIFRNKGKQIRPLFIFICSNICGKINDKTIRGAILIELLHTATLVHDDVVDEAKQRRGFFSINYIWKNKISVLVGDFLLSKGLLISVKNKDFDLLKITSKAVEQMSEGELLQIEKSRKYNFDEISYFEIIRKKTASLIASCCSVGASSSTADKKTINLFWEIGEYCGIAFQIKDDLLDFSKTNIIGKPASNDIKEKKITLPLIYSLQNCSKKEKKEILFLFKKKEKSPKIISDIISFIETKGGIDYAKSKMIQYKNKALTLIKSLPECSSKQDLISLLNFVVEREK